MFVAIVDEIDFGQRSSDQMGEDKVCVHAGSVPCVGRQEQGLGAAERRWKGQVEDLRGYSSYQDAVGIVGEPIEFEWKNLTGFTKVTILQQIQEDM